MWRFSTFTELCLLFMLLTWCTCSQPHSLMPISFLTISGQPTRPTHTPGIPAGNPVSLGANHSAIIRASVGVLHASLNDSAWGNHKNASYTSNGTGTSLGHNATRTTSRGASETRIKSANILPISPNGSTPTNATFLSEQPELIIGSSAANISAFIQASSALKFLPSGFIRATGGIAFGLPPRNSSRFRGGSAAEPLVTPPPAPPLQPNGLNLTSVKVVKVSNSAWSTNTSITTLSPGGSRPTVVPVLVKAAGAGLAIFGLSAGLEMGAPLLGIGEAVEIADDEAASEDEGDDGDDQQKSTSSMITSTSAMSTTSTALTSSSSWPTSSASSSSSSLQSSSTSKQAEACSNPTDYPHLGDADDYSSDEDYESSKVKRFAGESADMARRQLEQMSTYTNMKKPVTRLGSCTLDKNTNMPPFWKANSLMGKPGNSAYWYMPIPEEPDQLDAVPTYTTAATAALRTLSPTKKNVVIGGSSGFRTNVDHVFEVSLLKNFFNYYLAQKSVCRNFNSEFMANSTAENEASRLSVIFAQLPGVHFGGLAGMDQRLNSIKAYFFQAGEIQNGLGYRANGLCDSIKNLRMAGMVMDMLHSEELRGFFSDANSRIYQALLGADRAIAGDSSGGCSQLPKNGFSWAAEYKWWITWFLSEREIEIQNWARITQNAITNKLNQKTTVLNQNGDGKFVNVLDHTYDDDRKRMTGFLRSSYSQVSHWSFNFNLQYPTNALPMAKREDNDCARSSLLSSPTNSTPPPTSTQTAVNGAQQIASATVAIGDYVAQPHKAPVPNGIVNFISSGVGSSADSYSANHLNNEKSANQFNNAIQRISGPEDSTPSKVANASSQVQASSLLASSPATA